jgi:hypothetical protein
VTAFPQTACGRIERVRRLSDVLRRYHLGGQVVVSAGVHALGHSDEPALLQVVAVETTSDRRQNLLFCQSPPVTHEGAFRHDAEVSEVLVTQEPVETAFPLHTKRVGILQQWMTVTATDLHHAPRRLGTGLLRKLARPCGPPVRARAPPAISRAGLHDGHGGVTHLHASRCL